MDVRTIGTPITASQRRSYRETPDSSFYQTFQAAFAGLDAGSGQSVTNTSATRSLEEILGSTHSELSAMRGVSQESQASYAAVLNKAYGSGGMEHARQFLCSLSADELDAVRQNHCLADTINPTALSEEGARNLLLPEGYSVDLNHDGIDEVGAARTMSFPPKDAPASFKEAWFQATADMDSGTMMSYGLMMHGAVYGIQLNGQNDAPLYPPERLDSYRTIVANALAAVDDFKGFLAPGQYEQDKAFFGKLQTLLDA